MATRVGLFCRVAMKAFNRGPFTFTVIDKNDQKDEVVILLHGFPATAKSLLPLADQLAKAGYRVLIPELRGYTIDARPKQRSGYKLSELTDDIKKIVDTIGINRVHIIGHDWGGAVGWAFASAYPNRVASLTAISTPHPKAFAQSLYSSRQFFMSWYMLFFQLPFLPEWVISHNNGAILLKVLLHSGLNNKSTSAYVKRMQDKDSATYALGWYRALPFTLMDHQQIERIMCPTLFVYGSKDKFLSKKAADLTRQWVSGYYQEHCLSGEGHWLPEEQPHALASLVLGFLRLAASEPKKTTG